MKTSSLSRSLFSALLLTLGFMIGGGLAASLAHAEVPPADGERPPPPPEGGPMGEPHHPLLKMFDTNHDGMLDQAEVEAASAVLHAYDADANGTLDIRELVAALPPPRGEGMAMGRGRDRKGDGERPMQGARPPRG